MSKQGTGPHVWPCSTLHEHNNHCLACLQEIKDVMPPVFKIEDSIVEHSTDSFPPPLNMAPLPPMIVTEKGESLEEFCGRRYPDFFTSVQARLSLA
jgi:hypothetical protein